jgi:hypothetical protein
MDGTRPDWWHRPFWPYSRLTPWRGYALSAVLSAGLGYTLMRAYNVPVSDKWFLWGLWAWLGGRLAL